MSRYLSSSIAALVISAVVAASASAGIFHHKRHCEPTCGAEPTCCAVEPSCCAPEPTCCAEPVCCAEPTCCAAEPTCCAAEPTCCAAESCCPTNPCIKYHHKHLHKRHRCCSQGTFQTVLHATSPETCCSVCVPVCLPCCCEGCPAESSRCTLLGKGQVRYDYCCGVSVIIRFQKCGDICVTYVGF